MKHPICPIHHKPEQCFDCLWEMRTGRRAKPIAEIMAELPMWPPMKQVKDKAA